MSICVCEFKPVLPMICAWRLNDLTSHFRTGSGWQDGVEGRGTGYTNLTACVQSPDPMVEGKNQLLTVVI